MEGNLVVDEDLKQSIPIGAEEKLDAEQEVAFEVLSATYVLTFNDEAKTSWKMRRQLNSPRTKPPWNWQRRETEQTTNKLFECLLQDCLSWQM
jgi:hypothetical protein